MFKNNNIKKTKFFSEIDIISSTITLYYKGELLHPSIFSGSLSLMYCTVIMICGIYFLSEIFLKENPTVFFFIVLSKM